MAKKAAIFDLDGVIVSTDEYHYRAWKKLADEEGIYFDRDINENLRGISRMESLEIILKKSQTEYTNEQKLQLSERKNLYYKAGLDNLTPSDILPGVANILNKLKAAGVKTAIGSSSKNAPFILEKIGLGTFFDAVADGNGIKNSKPDPEVFLLAAKKLGVKPGECVVIEDAEAGIKAALAAGMKAVGVGYAAASPGVDCGAESLDGMTVERLLE